MRSSASANGKLRASAEAKQSDDAIGTIHYTVVPIRNDVITWGQLEVQFRPIFVGINRLFSTSLLLLLGSVALTVGVVTWWHLRRVLRYLDPSKCVPPRVREVLNSFAEGVIVVDTEDRIVLANQSFANYVGKGPDEIVGCGLYDFRWNLPPIPDEGEATTNFVTVAGRPMQLLGDNGTPKYIFSVNSSPVLDDEGKYHGLLMAFTDVTPLENHRTALMSALQELVSSKREISRQNEELRYLATRDPLTTCLNRRTFFELFDQHWAATKSCDSVLSVAMIDIDHFKSINDTYGHSMGDEVLRKTGELLCNSGASCSIAFRYGGEEFAVLLPGYDAEKATRFCEQFRKHLCDLQFPGFQVTASIGLSSTQFGAESPQSMLDQADKCLYMAKRSGRNQVVSPSIPTSELQAVASRMTADKTAGVVETSLIPLPISYDSLSPLDSASH